MSIANLAVHNPRAVLLAFQPFHLSVAKYFRSVLFRVGQIIHEESLHLLRQSNGILIVRFLSHSCILHKRGKYWNAKVTRYAPVLQSPQSLHACWNTPCKRSEEVE